MEQTRDRVARFFLIAVRVKGSARMAIRATVEEFGWKRVTIYKWVNDYRRIQRNLLIRSFGSASENKSVVPGHQGDLG